MSFNPKKPEVSFFTVMFQNIDWSLLLTYNGLLSFLEELKIRYKLYEYIIKEELAIPEDLAEEEYISLFALDDEMYDYVYYKGWTETIPMILTYIMFLTGSYWISFFIIAWSYDEISDYYINEFHADNMDESEPPEVDEFESPVYEPTFFYYDIHNYSDYELLYFHYIHRFRRKYKF